jgi:hypothetical protein
MDLRHSFALSACFNAAENILPAAKLASLRTYSGSETS